MRREAVRPRRLPRHGGFWLPSRYGRPMPNSRTTFETMMEGVEPLDVFVSSLNLSATQKLKLLGVKALVAVHRNVLRHSPSSKARNARWGEEMAALTDLKLASWHPDPGSLRGGHYLSAEEIAAFERDGVIGPFEVLPADEARALADQAEAWHDDEFEAKGVMTDDLVAAFRAAGTWSINYSGLFQGHRKAEIWDVMCNPKITDRVASLLGDDVLLWRSQFFQKKPGDRGTFWHQNSVFRETASAGKLVPPPGVSPGMAQLTAWVALRDVTVANGALRIMPGSCADARFEYVYSLALDHMVEFLAELPPSEIDDMLKAGLFSSGSFQRVQALFAASVHQIGPIFEGLEVRDLTMRAGEAVIFTSLNMHASHPNTTTDQTRLAMGARYTAGDVGVFRDMSHDHFPSPGGPLPFPLGRLAPMLAHGQANTQVNPVVLTEPYPDDTELRAPGPVG
jgi:non-haem Fe2+, alpha-ketoglutarate-dependent halogenase